MSLDRTPAQRNPMLCREPVPVYRQCDPTMLNNEDPAAITMSRVDLPERLRYGQ